MKYQIFFFLSSIIVVNTFSMATNAQEVHSNKDTAGYLIKVALQKYNGQKLYWGTYSGNKKIIIDSILLNTDGEGILQGTTKKTSGLYFFVNAEKTTILYDFLMDDTQHFSVQENVKKTGLITSGSADNKLYEDYELFSAEQYKKIAAAKQKFATAKTKKDTLEINNTLRLIGKETSTYRENISSQNEQSLLAFLLRTLAIPTPHASATKEKHDSLFAYRYAKEHYWDGVMFNDDRLLHTPFFESKLDRYFEYYVPLTPDSVYKEIQYMLLSARTSKEMYPFLLLKFTNAYIAPKYMGFDKVFVHLYEDFYAKGDTVYLSSDGKKQVTKQAFMLMSNLIGNHAPELNLTEAFTNATIPLSSVQGAFILVVFWDPNCGHCQKSIPLLDSFYRASWNKKGLQVYSVLNTEQNLDDFKKFIIAHHLTEKGWINVYQTTATRNAIAAARQPSMHQLYDIYQTPKFFLLNKNHEIIGKDLSLAQFGDLMATVH